MAHTPLVGLTNVYLGDVANDGGLGTSLDPMGYTVEGTPVLTTEEGEQTDFPIEESDTPYYSITTPGNKVLTFSAYGFTAEFLQKHFGGNYTPGLTSADPDVWEAPLQAPEKEQSIVLVHKQGGYLAIPRGKVTVSFEWKFQKNSLPQANFSIVVLTPTKPNTAPLYFNSGSYTP